MVQIKKHRSFTELQFGIAALFLGNKAIIFLSIFMMGILFSMFERFNEEDVLRNMRIVQICLEYFATNSINGIYPVSMNDKTIQAKTFSELLDNPNIEWMLKNPYTNQPSRVLFKERPESFPSWFEKIKIPPGDIYIFCNGTRYVIFGGDRKGNSLQGITPDFPELFEGYHVFESFFP